MEKFKYNLTLAAKNQPEAKEKAEALQKLASKLSAKELNKLAHVVMNDPVKTAMAKKYLGV